MDKNAQMISNCLSLRTPQKQALEILNNLLDKLILHKNINLVAELDKVKSICPTCTDFERNFVSICFALATGVGKTRLMGAFIAYLYLEKGIKNFFVLAPNLTVYKKLIADFSDPTHPKYVFQGIGELSQYPPRIITGDNYTQAAQRSMLNSEINLNIFNISKINAETRQGTEPKIKRLSEYLGDSYFNYLANLDDLVLLMDESHHYRADRGMQVINELNPVLGLELTATPQVEKAGSAIKFKNVVYEYSLARAIEDGFVKEPAVATRKDFNPASLMPEDIDLIKIQDGICIHEDTKVALEIYARNNKVDAVKPFVLIVAKDTEHAGTLKRLIQSKSFFEGRYANKVMELHSNQKGMEKEENIQQLLSLEDSNNPIEIVIHVNMLKEGWDVNNLYTIIPLRTAASQTLREQTIGRGLRLPYGKRTGDKRVDTLTIIAHDRFQEIIDAANRPDSIIKQKNIITIDIEEIQHTKEVIVSLPRTESLLLERKKEIALISNDEQRQQGEWQLQTEQEIINILPQLNTKFNSLQDLSSGAAQTACIDLYQAQLRNQPQQELFTDIRVEEARAMYQRVVQDFLNNIIEIPRVVVQQTNDVSSGFYDFDLDASKLHYQPVSQEILIQYLREQEDGIRHLIGKGRIVIDKLDKIIVNELINIPEVDYDTQAILLFKLAIQAIEHFRSYLKYEQEVDNVVQYNKHEIARFIFSQMQEHFYCKQPQYENVKVLPFVSIEPHNYTKYAFDTIYPYTETIEPTSSIPSKIFIGFKKACHDKYKFDSKTEKDFAIILENDQEVLKWMRPAEKQFEIWWSVNNSKRYCPDFVVETANTIYMVETKMLKETDSEEVKAKAKAALHYCNLVNKFALEVGKKPWKYLLIPHDEVKFNISFTYFAKHFNYYL
ncbi:MAG: hypothetical protein A2X78_01395 [Gammaproteobacteria bacterium GWE2_37_16]|nr:MAG: hypothetical protein A2X78_01395 [Gammaproteobacteria bacterium GWE2_37_16]